LDVSTTVTLVGYFESLKQPSRTHLHWENLRSLSADLVEPGRISISLSDSSYSKYNLLVLKFSCLYGRYYIK
jgi:hypothetical protein